MPYVAPKCSSTCFRVRKYSRHRRKSVHPAARVLADFNANAKAVCWQANFHASHFYGVKILAAGAFRPLTSHIKGLDWLNISLI